MHPPPRWHDPQAGRQAQGKEAEGKEGEQAGGGDEQRHAAERGGGRPDQWCGGGEQPMARHGDTHARQGQRPERHAGDEM